MKVEQPDAAAARTRGIHELAPGVYAVTSEAPTRGRLARLPDALVEVGAENDALLFVRVGAR